MDSGQTRGFGVHGRLGSRRRSVEHRRECGYLRDRDVPLRAVPATRCAPVRPTGPASSSTDSPAAARSACSATATAAVYGPRGAGSLEVTEPSLRSRARMPGGHFAPLHRGDEASHCGPLEPADPLYRRRPDRGRGLDDRLLELRLRSPPIFRSRPIAAKPTTARHMTGRGSEIRELGDEPATGRPAGVRHRAAACAVTRLPRRSGARPVPCHHILTGAPKRGPVRSFRRNVATQRPKRKGTS